MTLSDYPPAGGCDHTLTDDGGGFFCAGSWGHAGDHKLNKDSGPDEQWPTGWDGVLWGRWRTDTVNGVG